MTKIYFYYFYKKHNMNHGRLEWREFGTCQVENSIITNVLLR